MNVLLERNDEGINSGWSLLMVQRKAKPSPPNENPVTRRPKNTIKKTFQQWLCESATVPNMQM